MSLILRLPVPPAPNRFPSHHMALHNAKMRYQGKAWLAAIQQHLPSQEPPAFVTLHAMFLLVHPRDDDGLFIKWVLDALKQKQIGRYGKPPKLNWRHGLYDKAGYFQDDDPTHLRLERPWQERCSSRKLEELVLEIE